MVDADAGKCEKCGFSKSWDKRVLNPKTGKMMPGHLDKDGNLLNGNGECPFWAALKKKQTAVANDDPAKKLFEEKPAAAAPAPAAKDTTELTDKPLTITAYNLGVEMLIKAFEKMEKELLAALRPAAVYDEAEHGVI